MIVVAFFIDDLLLFTDSVDFLDILKKRLRQICALNYRIGPDKLYRDSVSRVPNDKVQTNKHPNGR